MRGRAEIRNSCGLNVDPLHKKCLCPKYKQN